MAWCAWWTSYDILPASGQTTLVSIGMLLLLHSEGISHPISSPSFVHLPRPSTTYITILLHHPSLDIRYLARK